MFQRGIGNGEIQFAIAFSPIILAPRHFIGIGRKIWTGDVVVCPDFRAAEPREEAFRHIG